MVAFMKANGKIILSQALAVYSIHPTNLPMQATGTKDVFMGQA